jgi:hypothetical protein
LESFVLTLVTIVEEHQERNSASFQNVENLAGVDGLVAQGADVERIWTSSKGKITRDGKVVKPNRLGYAVANKVKDNERTHTAGPAHCRDKGVELKQHIAARDKPSGIRGKRDPIGTTRAAKQIGNGLGGVDCIFQIAETVDT